MITTPLKAEVFLYSLCVTTRRRHKAATASTAPATHLGRYGFDGNSDNDPVQLGDPYRRHHSPVDRPLDADKLPLHHLAFHAYHWRHRLGPAQHRYAVMLPAGGRASRSRFFTWLLSPGLYDSKCVHLGIVFAADHWRYLLFLVSECLLLVCRPRRSPANTA